MAFSLPQMTASTGGNNGQQGFALGLASAGSAGMGTDLFTNLGIKSL